MMKRHAFSLVELSIVLVILGLLVGGVLAGKSLIRAAELRAVGAEYARYKTAISAFRDKYFAVPGDMANATGFWGTAGTCPGVNASPSTDATTCNGDGDGAVEASPNELFRFWQHLANAGLIEGQYTGVPGATATIQASLGVNAPRSKLANAGWGLHDRTGAQLVSSTYQFEGDYTNSLAFGGGGTGAPDITVMKAEEAWNIDTKLDDGKPGLGVVRAYENHTNCHDAGTSTTVALATTANYSLASSIIGCALQFKSQ